MIFTKILLKVFFIALVLIPNFLTSEALGTEHFKEFQSLSDMSQSVDMIFSEFNKPQNPGANVAVVRGDKYLHAKGYGRMSIEYDLPWTLESRSRLYSASKHFVGVACLLLEDQGKLTLEDDIRKYLPEMPQYAQKITLRHLLSNTSGIRDDEGTLNMFGFNATYPISLEYIYDNVITRMKKLNFSPGSACLYSNSGFRLIAMIIERVSGKSFPEWMEQNIFKPLEMNNTLVAQYDYEVAENMASGYDWTEEGRFKKARLRVGTSGDGGIVSTIPDMLKWFNNFRSNRLGIHKFPARLVDKTKLGDGRISHYGLGINTIDYRGIRALHHGGGADGYQFQFYRFPEQDLTVIVFANRTDVHIRPMVQKVVNVYLSADLQEREGEKKNYSSVDSKKHEKLKGLYVNADKGLVVDVSIPEKWANADLYMGGAVGIRMRAIEDFEFESVSGYSSEVARFDFIEGKERPNLLLNIGLGGDTLFSPVDEIKLSEKELEKFTGTFKCDEISEPIQIIVKNQKLVMKLGRGVLSLQWKTLKPVLPYVFYTNYRSMRFFADKDGNISGMLLNGTHSRFFEFTKVEGIF